MLIIRIPLSGTASTQGLCFVLVPVLIRFHAPFCFWDIFLLFLIHGEEAMRNDHSLPQHCNKKNNYKMYN